MTNVTIYLLMKTRWLRPMLNAKFQIEKELSERILAAMYAELFPCKFLPGRRASRMGFIRRSVFVSWRSCIETVNAFSNVCYHTGEQHCQSDSNWRRNMASRSDCCSIRQQQRWNGLQRGFIVQSMGVSGILIRYP